MISKLIIGLTALALVVFSLCTYTVDGTERAILFKFGEIKQADIKPGLHWKIPFINNVRIFDSRILEMFFKIDSRDTSFVILILVGAFHPISFRFNHLRNWS